jgi:hypothetical protein
MWHHSSLWHASAGDGKQQLPYRQTIYPDRGTLIGSRAAGNTINSALNENLIPALHVVKIGPTEGFSLSSSLALLDPRGAVQRRRCLRLLVVDWAFCAVDHPTPLADGPC